MFLLLTNAMALQSFDPFLESSPRLMVVGIVLVSAHCIAFLTFRAVRSVSAQITIAITALIGAALVASRGDLTNLSALLTQAFAQFQNSTPPTPATDAYIATLVLLAATLGWLSTWIAIQMRTSLEAILPPIALCAMSATLAGDRINLSAALRVVVCCVLFLVTHRSWIDLTRHDWLPGTLLAEERRYFRRDIPTAAAVLAATTLLFVNVEWLTSPGLIDWQNYREQTTTSFSIDPLVDIGSQLRDRDTTDAVAFTAVVQTDAPLTTTAGYWRLEGRTEYRNGSWPANTDQLSQQTDRTGNDQAARVTQQITVGALRATTVPALYQPVGVSSTLATIDPATETVTARDPIGRGDVFVIDSLVNAVYRDQLDSARGIALDPQLVATATDDTGLIPELKTQAALLTRDATSDLERVELIQSWFRQEFVYDDSVNFDQGELGLAQFAQSRRGFCQQYATAFTLMARSLDLPTRLAIGFTNGQQIRPNVFEVYANQVHVWPEVFFDGVGWVAFEPTPTRGSAALAQYTDVEDQQATPPTTATTPTVATTTPTSTTPTVTTTTTSTAIEAPAESTNSRSSNLAPILVTVLALAVVATIAAVTLRRRQRLTHHRDPWLALEHRLAPYVSVDKSLTVIERADVIAQHVEHDPASGQLIVDLGELATQHSQREFEINADRAVNAQRYDDVAKRLVVVLAAKTIA